METKQDKIKAMITDFLNGKDVELSGYYFDVYSYIENNREDFSNEDVLKVYDGIIISSAEELSEVYRSELRALNYDYGKRFENALGVKGICAKMHPSRCEFYHGTHGKAVFGTSVDVYINDGVIELNVGSCGSFGVDNYGQVAKYKAVASFIENNVEIEGILLEYSNKWNEVAKKLDVNNESIAKLKNK